MPGKRRGNDEIAQQLAQHLVDTYTCIDDVNKRSKEEVFRKAAHKIYNHRHVDKNWIKLYVIWTCNRNHVKSKYNAIIDANEVEEQAVEVEHEEPLGVDDEEPLHGVQVEPLGEVEVEPIGGVQEGSVGGMEVVPIREAEPEKSQDKFSNAKASSPKVVHHARHPLVRNGLPRSGERWPNNPNPPCTRQSSKVERRVLANVV